MNLNFNFKGITKTDIKVKDTTELKQLVNNLIQQYGNQVDLNNIDVSDIVYFNSIFIYKNYFEGDVSEWDVSSGNTFENMFFDCNKFNGDISEWDVSNGKFFSWMFTHCKSFNSNLSKWDVSNGEYFHAMFYGCESFNADLSKWNVSNAKNWDNFASFSLLEKYPNRIPEKFRGDYL